MIAIVKSDTRFIDNMTVKAYREYKKKILQKDFRIRLSADQIAHFDTLETDRQIEQYFIAILNSRFG